MSEGQQPTFGRKEKSDFQKMTTVSYSIHAVTHVNAALKRYNQRQNAVSLI